MKKVLLAALALLLPFTAQAASPFTFTEAKVVAKQKIYFDQTNSTQGKLYCGCHWTWTGNVSILPHVATKHARSKTEQNVLNGSISYRLGFLGISVSAGRTAVVKIA